MVSELRSLHYSNDTFRCFGDGDPLYEVYHDTEWGFPVVGESALFERLSLEIFQTGLSWRVVLHKRDALRKAFMGFEPTKLAQFNQQDKDRLLANRDIIRNGQKISAIVANADAVLRLWDRGDSLSRLIWSFVPQRRGFVPKRPVDVPTQSEESRQLAYALKQSGFRFIGAITAYSTMQAVGMVNDHLEHCPVRRILENSVRPRVSP